MCPKKEIYIQKEKCTRDVQQRSAQSLRNDKYVKRDVRQGKKNANKRLTKKAYIRCWAAAAVIYEV